MTRISGAEVRTPYLLKFHDIFPEEEANADMLLAGIPKSLILQSAMNFAEYHNHYDRDENIFHVLYGYFHGRQNAEIRWIFDRINVIQESQGRSAHFIYPPSSLRLIDNEKIPNFRSFLATEFTEEFLLQKLLTGIFSNKALQLSGKSIKNLRIAKKSNLDGEPDYYVRDFNNVYLFECKDALIKKEVKESMSYPEVETELKSKLLETFNKGKRQSKAIHQIIDQIISIKSENIDFDDSKNLRVSRIYPILILTEEVFNATGLNQLINEWFQDELKERGKKLDIKLNKIEPIIIITVDTLLYMRPYLLKGRIRIKDILDAYIHKHLIQPTNQKKWSQDRMISFSLFVKAFIWHNCRNSLEFSKSVMVDGNDELNNIS